MEAIIYTHACNMTANKVLALAYDQKLLSLEEVENAHVMYFDGDIQSWFGTKEQVVKNSRGKQLFVHIDYFTVTPLEIVMELAEKFGFTIVKEE